MSVVFLLSLVYCAFSADLRQWDLVPPENYKPQNESEPGICFGSSVLWSQYPYMAALRYGSGSACCSASIISLNPGILLSAAHCNGCTGQPRVGCNNPSSSNCGGADAYTIQSFIQDPSYQQGTQFSNDVSVILLTNPITTSGAQAIGIPNVEPTQGNVRATGYGITETGAIPSAMQTCVMNEIERTQCQSIMESALGGGTYVDASMVCARGGSAGQDNVPGTCSGDSGGPWVSTAGSNQQWGITSWGLQGSGAGCNSCNCCVGYPSVGANVANRANFINGYLNAWKKGDFNYTYTE